MLKKEYFSTRPDGVVLYRTYSDSNMMILQTDTGIEYQEAIDVDGSPHVYEETANAIEQNESENEA